VLKEADKSLEQTVDNLIHTFFLGLCEEKSSQAQTNHVNFVTISILD